MRVRPPLRVGITRHDEKEQKLREFVRHHLEPSADGSVSAQGVLMVVARSVDSPVVKAILSLDQEIATAQLPVRIIFAQLENDALPDTWEQDSRRLACEVRWARRPRLIEAHEQLVLGPLTCWIGDCMRRDPAKCDAFENFIDDCGEAAGCAAVSFERLWVASEPLTKAAAALAEIAPEAIAGMDAGTAPEIGTRH